MSKRQITDAQLREACAQVRDRMLSELEGQEDPAFSAAFQENIRALNRRSLRAGRLRTLGRWAAAAVLMLVLGAGMVFTISPDASASAVEWFRQNYQTMSWYWFPEERFFGSVDYAPTWLPEDYTLSIELADDQHSAWRHLYYQRDGSLGDSIAFHVQWMGDGSRFVLDTEDTPMEVSEVVVNGMPGDLYRSLDPEAVSYLVWVDEGRRLLFYISARLDPEDILHIAESVSLEVPTN